MTKEPEIFRALQNKDLPYLVSTSSKLARSYRFPFVFLLTCDRAEVISEEKAGPEPLERALDLQTLRVKAFRYSLEASERDILVFTTGITSPLFGEDTLQGQIAMALEASRLSGTSSPYLRKLLSSSVAFSKRLHTELKLRVFDKTITDEIERRTEGRGDILIIGSGDSARQLAERLKGKHRVTMTLRDTEKLFLLPPGVECIDYAERFEKVKGFDTVISSTSGLYYSFGKEDLWRLSGKLLFDLSSPPDLPPEAGAVTVSSLGIELPERDRVVRKVWEEAGKEEKKIGLWRENSEGFEALNEKAERIASEALRRLSGPISALKLEEEEEMTLRGAIQDSVRKAAITENLKKTT